MNPQSLLKPVTCCGVGDRLNDQFIFYFDEEGDGVFGKGVGVWGLDAKAFGENGSEHCEGIV